MTTAKNLLSDFRFNSILLLGIFVAAYWIPLSGMVHTWSTNDDYSYGFIIPIASLYLFWEGRKELKEVVLNSTWGVFPVLLFFVVVSIYGVLGSSGHVSRPAIPILIILFCAFCYGISFVKRFALPLGFLFFMVPLPTVLDRTFGVFLKSISSQLGGEFIRLVGLPVHVSGNVIDLGVTQLQVVDACSGLRFVFPLMAIGVLYAYFFERILWKRVFCVLITIPIAIITNVLRIGITGILVNYFGSQIAEGFFHGFSGWAIFMVAFVFLFLVGRVLRFFPPKYAPPDKNGKPVGEEEDKAENPKAYNAKAFIVSIFILIAVGGLTWNTKAMPPVRINGGLSIFPLEFSGWTGQREFVDTEIIDASGAEDAFSATYRNADVGFVNLYMGYRSSAFLENENFFHSPTVCLPSSGWKTIGMSTRTIANVPLFGSLSVTSMVIEKFNQKQLVYFWFQTKDKATPDKNINRLHLAMHAIQKDNTHDLFMRPLTPIKRNETVAQAQERLDTFVREMMSVLLEFLDKHQVVGA